VDDLWATKSEDVGLIVRVLWRNGTSQQKKLS